MPNERAIARAWFDTLGASNDWRIRSAAILASAGWAAATIPYQADPHHGIAGKVVLGAMAVIAGPLAVFALVLVISWAIAPTKQRNEARRTRDQLATQLGGGKISHREAKDIVTTGISDGDVLRQRLTRATTRDEVYAMLHEIENWSQTTQNGIGRFHDSWLLKVARAGEAQHTSGLEEISKESLSMFMDMKLAALAELTSEPDE